MYVSAKAVCAVSKEGKMSCIMLVSKWRGQHYVVIKDTNNIYLFTLII